MGSTYIDAYVEDNNLPWPDSFDAFWKYLKIVVSGMPSNQRNLKDEIVRFPICLQLETSVMTRFLIGLPKVLRP